MNLHINAWQAGQRQHAQNPVRRRIAPEDSQGPGNQAKQNCVRKILQATQSTKEVQKIVEKALEMYFKGS